MSRDTRSVRFNMDIIVSQLLTTHGDTCGTRTCPPPGRTILANKQPASRTPRWKSVAYPGHNMKRIAGAAQCEASLCLSKATQGGKPDVLLGASVVGQLAEDREIPDLGAIDKLFNFLERQNRGR